MPGLNKNKGNQKEAVMSRTALLEQLVSQIDGAQKSASSSYHYSELAERSLSNANDAIAESVKSLAMADYEQADRLLNVAWFYAKFAQDIVGAESTEHLLGNDCFLDLIEPASEVQANLKELVATISNMLHDFEGSIPQLWQSDSPKTPVLAQEQEPEPVAEPLRKREREH
jgi:hypothetical protein